MSKSPPVFVDTNVLAYALDDADPRKQQRAQHLLEAHASNLVISTQVLIELYAVCVSKLGMSASDAAAAVRAAAQLSVVPADRDLMLQTVDLAASNSVSVFDAAIVCAALRAGCEQMFSEDVAIAEKVDGLDVVDPFTD